MDTSVVAFGVVVCIWRQPACVSFWQENFKHYRDLWRLNSETWEWEQLPGRGGPSARSGHRMALHKHRIVLFGGFQDTGKVTTYARMSMPLVACTGPDVYWRPVLQHAHAVVA